ncbi:MAG: TldD/PmbA family protein [Asgard group archaeon]|nr:TldD/PmbA family protein [Asgard group archaeon]
MKFDTIKDELLALADTGVKYAKDKGADQAEIYISSNNQMTLQNQSGMINARNGLNEGVGIRVSLDNKLGFAAMSGLTDESIKNAITEALTVARNVQQENEGFESFATKNQSGKDGIIDDDIITLSTEDAVKYANTVFLEAKDFDKRVIAPSAHLQTFYGGYAIANSEGVSSASKYTAFVLYSTVTAAENGKRKSAYQIEVQRAIPKIAGIGKKAAEKAVDLLTSKPLDYNGKLPTLWNPTIMSNYWQMAFIHSINGRQVVEKNSYFMDKLGDKVGIDDLTIVDDGQLKEGINTNAIDEEGVPRSSTPIIEDGVLRSFLYDTYYGRLGKAESTGNASRSSGYESTPNISPTTLVVQKGDKTFDELVTNIDKGIYIMDNVMGLGHSNLISGDFSIVATSSYLIEDGEIKHPLESLTIAGNLYKSLKNIQAMGSDIELFQSVKTPSVVFEGFTVNG